MKNEDELIEPPRSDAPICPHCLEDPARIRTLMAGIGELQSAVFFCGNPECRRILTISVVGIQQTIARPNIRNGFVVPREDCLRGM